MMLRWFRFSRCRFVLLVRRMTLGCRKGEIVALPILANRDVRMVGQPFPRLFLKLSIDVWLECVIEILDERKKG